MEREMAATKPTTKSMTTGERVELREEVRGETMAIAQKSNVYPRFIEPPPAHTPGR